MQASGSDSQLRNQCPADLRKLPPVRISSEDEVKSAVVAARAAQPAWEAAGFEQRVRLLRRASKQMLERRQEVLELLHEEGGKPPGEVLMNEALGPLQYLNDWVRVIRPYLKPRAVPMSPIAFPGKRGVTEVVARGVIGIITPWNYPLGNLFRGVFPALLCGDAVVLKPSEYSPRTAAWFVEVIGEFVPKGVLNCVQGNRDVGKMLIRSGIDAVTFTGSFPSGQAVAKLAAEQMIPCSFELGGKDAAIVLADCDLDRTVGGVMQWALSNAGQACGAIERVYVEEAIADRFVTKLAGVVSRLRVGSGDPETSDLGPLAHAAQLAIVEDHVGDALARGAKLVAGGKRAGNGLWFEPTVLDKCDHRMKVMTEPTFGPVIPVARVRDTEEAVGLANDCAYGLNASVWSKDIKRATAIARRLDVGTAYVNNHAFTGGVAASPWTGTKKTGYGIANSVFALNHYTRPRTLVTDRSTSPEPYWFPLTRAVEELGHRLADAQLARLSSAAKIPLLLLKRRREVATFLRSNRAGSNVSHLPLREHQPRDDAHETLSTAGARIGSLVSALARRVQPPLTEKELVWGRAVLETMFPMSKENPLPPLPKEESDAFLRDMHRQFPVMAGLGMRAAILTAALTPMMAKRRWVTLDRLSPEERLETMEWMYKSDFYLLRQVGVLLKTTGGLSHATTTRFHAAVARRQAPLRQVAKA
jgi:acyl-CoA reductase-like NAD-dependent aldehyde dehydrogenase